MSINNDLIEIALNSPITEEQWDAITDVDFEHTNKIWFHTKHGKNVEFTKVIPGYWIYKWNPYFKQELPYCSVCEKASPSVRKTYYCPNCGAKMDNMVPLLDSDDIYGEKVTECAG